MKQWFQLILILGGGLCLILGLSSALVPGTENREGTRKLHALVLRQIAHDYLLCNGDSTSLIPAVEIQPDGSMVLPLARALDYTELGMIAREAIGRYGIAEAYTLSLVDCQTRDVFLGSLWPGKSSANKEFPAACTSREQDERCAHLALAFKHTEFGYGTSFWGWLLLPGALLLFYAAWFTLRPRRGGEIPLPTIHEESALLPAPPTNIVFDAQAHSLRVGEETFELTHRENKLFRYFWEHPREVLTRADIHAAVWGDEGIIVGRSLDVFVSRIRKKLAHAEGMEIVTVHGVGYRVVLKTDPGTC